MFNHAKRNNVGFILGNIYITYLVYYIILLYNNYISILDKKNMQIKYITMKNIEIGTELCINYGTKVWFDDADNAEDLVTNPTGNNYYILYIIY
jgi:hypothetical protein